MPSTEAVTYQFARFYYSQLHEDPSKLYQLYTSDAKLTHSKTPTFTAEELSNNVKKPIETETLSSNAEIAKFYSDLNLKNSKVRITYIDSQSVLNEKSILVNVVGELALTDESPVFRFNQSFILTPGSVKDSYDIANDIFRLIPDDYFETGVTTKEDKVEKSEEIVEGPKEIKEEVTEEPKVEKVIDESNSKEQAAITVPTTESVKQSAAKTPEAIEPSKERASPEASAHPKQPKQNKTPKQESKPHAKKETKSPKSKPVKIESKDQEAKVNDESSQKPEASEEQKENVSSAPAKPSVPLSWADQLLSASDKPFTKAKSAPKAKEPTKTTPESTSTTTSGEVNQPTKSTTNGTATPASTQKQPSKKRHEFSHSVHVDNTGDLTATELKNELEKEFGKTVKVEPKGLFALVSFETAESRQKALKKRNHSIKDSTVLISEMKDGMEFSKKASQNSSKSNNKSNQRQNNGSNVNKKRTTPKQNA